MHYICVNTRNTDTRAKSGSILHLQLINTKYPLITMQQQLKHAAEPLSLNIGSFYKPILPVKEMKDCQLELLCLQPFVNLQLTSVPRVPNYGLTTTLVTFVTLPD